MPIPQLPISHFPFHNLLSLQSVSMIPWLSERGLDERINDAFMPVAVWWENTILSEIVLFGYGIPVVLIILLSGALFFTFYFGFVNVRHFSTAIQVVRGKYDALEKEPLQSGKEASEVVANIAGEETRGIRDALEVFEGASCVSALNESGPKASRNEADVSGYAEFSGEVNHFQALATAVSGTVGLGNIAMVAVAVSIGGPGATFWMILAGLLGMSTKFVECTLGVKYRDIDKSGNVYGGPMYYLSRGLKRKGFDKLGKFLAVLFSILCIGASFGGGNAFQSNQAAAQIIERFGLTGPSTGSIIGSVFALLTGIVIIGGIKRIAKVTEKVVPFMAILYVGGALFIIASQWQWVDDALVLIVTEAFSPHATITGGFVGVMIQGFRRAAFSNEAGAGSAAIAHAAVNTKHPVSEGLVALLEPFIDTVLVCTITAIVIVLFNMEGVFVYGDVLNGEALMQDGSRLGGVNLTSMAFESSISGSSYVLMVAVCLFAFSTILSWSYYGLQAWKYLFGRGRVIDLAYKILFLLFTVLGAAITLDAVIKFSDAMILALVFPNMVGLLILFPEVKKEFVRYLGLIAEKKA